MSAALSIPPPRWLPVLLGHGVFIRGGDGKVQLDKNRNPDFLVPPADSFLDVVPSKGSQQFWPVGVSPGIPENTSIVLLSISVNTHCQNPEVITEVGFTIYDTAAIYTGTKSGQGKRIAGCEAPGPRGENITKYATSRHYIVKDAANHHPGSCEHSNHTAQPYHFSYRKSKKIDRENIDNILDGAFEAASQEGLRRDDVKNKTRRFVVLVGWGAESHHAQVRARPWYQGNKVFQHWDIRKHSLVHDRMGNPSYLTCLEVFGIQHRAHGKEIGYNAGNHTAFTIQLLVALCFLTQAEQLLVKSKQNLPPGSRFPGTESVLARDNRPPGSAPAPVTFEFQFRIDRRGTSR
ncbi:hypothetical protein F4808DRAFT_187151 [Astrocystis sublimbata]|nr:hypothetical protein F4808DRAFT_187151 [Astrocystis sublimbata]